METISCPPERRRRKDARIVSYYGRALSVAEIAALEKISYRRAYDKYARPSSKFSQLDGQLSII